MLSPTAKFGYILGLDGLRAFSVLIVLVAHFGLDYVVPGGFGVTVFFFISGFLITRLLIAESEKENGINLFHFYLRRFARLYPALLFMVFGSSLLFAVFALGGPTKSELFAAIFYGTNILLVLKSEGMANTYMSWTPLWSLAVEEHFYLFFPALIVLLNRKWDRIIRIITALLFLVLLWRFFIIMATNLETELYTYVMTDTRIDSIMWGCFLALLLHTRNAITQTRWLVGFWPMGVAILMLLSTFLVRDPVFRNTLRYSLQGAALLILFMNLYYNRNMLFAIRILEWAPLVWLGRLSYPLYLWHFVMLDFWQRVLGNSPFTIFLAVLSSFTLASISFYWVEKPTIAIRKRFGAHIVTKK
ncbi:hypothetical protein MNBD_ALPHA06-1170 [hydrothermal vent metagenome]|uniref:Acyltransferase 3 domain-containing protein n=1 Tax=hydrothermal vent metagenome TaxID=652676 RepID=A0A3B0SKR7_9ZZZZ